MTTNNYYVTFSERFRTEVHPLQAAATPDGYVTVNAASMDEAHLLAYREFNAYYRDICTEPPACTEGELWTVK